MASGDREERLEAFERMLRATLEEYDATVARMGELRDEGAVRSATYRQLTANKLRLQSVIETYRLYNLV